MKYRIRICCLFVTVGLLAACALPDVPSMNGQLPIRIDHTTGPDFDCSLAITSDALGLLYAIKDWLKDKEPERRQAITNFFQINPGPGVVTVGPSTWIETEGRRQGWTPYLKYALTGGLAALGTYRACADQFLVEGGIYYWCGAEHRYPGVNWYGMPEDAKAAWFFESGWYVCDGRPGLSTTGYAIEVLSWLFGGQPHGAQAVDDSPPFDPNAPLPGPTTETIPVPCVPTPPAYGPPGCIPGTGT